MDDSSKTEQFINKAIIKHGSSYSYINSVYVNRQTKIKIDCCACGVAFEQRPDSHLRGSGCLKCSREKTRIKLTPSTTEYVKKAVKVHGTKFDYSDLIYHHSESKITIKCNRCLNYVEISSKHHLEGSGCAICARNNLSNSKLMNQTEFIDRATQVHDNIYDYAKVIYTGLANKIIIICKNCNDEFNQYAGNHLSGSGCLKCVKIKTDLLKRKPEVEVRYELTKDSDDLFDYSDIGYKTCSEKIVVTCKRCTNKHSVYIHNHRKHHSCPYCMITVGHREIIDYLNSLGIGELIINDRKSIAPYEFDILIPKYKLAIEFNGIYYHSYDHDPDNKLINRHQIKALKSLEKNITLLQFWSFEWENQRDNVKSIINRHLGLLNNIDADQCKTIEINTNYFGLTHNNDIVAKMVFYKDKESELEIIECVNMIGINVIGGLSKLISHLCDTYPLQNVIHFIDLRLENGFDYKKHGFIESEIIEPKCFYTNGRDNMVDHYLDGYRKIWDAGRVKLLFRVNH